jgi:DNA polymerase V
MILFQVEIKILYLYVRVRGDSMRDLNIHNGMIAVVDRLKKPENGSIVVARLGSAYTIKKWKEIETYTKRRKFYLVPANPEYNQIKINEADDFEIIGVVTHGLMSF